MKPIYTLLCAFLSVSLVHASDDAVPPKQHAWPFEGMRGQVNRQAAQRGFQVYKEVCASCHALHHASYRNLTELGFSPEEVKAIAAEATVTDGPNDEGEMFERPALPSDRFARPYPNEAAARAVNNGSYPVDLSLIIKARHDGANYLYSLLTAYEKAPEGFDLPPSSYYNPHFPGKVIKMPPPLTEGLVTYQDGTTATVEQMAEDVVTFLQWVAEPEMERRKAMGLKVLLYFSVLTLFFIAAKRRIWSRLK